MVNLLGATLPDRALVKVNSFQIQTVYFSANISYSIDRIISLSWNKSSNFISYNGKITIS